MLTRRIPGATRQMARGQDEYTTLWIKDVPIEFNGKQANMMSCCFEPTPDELARLNAGASITLSVLGTVFQPVILTVGEAPE